ncbi:MAG: FtsX-like permease family protein [Candidatus Thalassarchaeaceae archaeon]|nr:FtsX-like permease family protein [Candidatus Thalassarchaeaceae archaeon]
MKLLLTKRLARSLWRTKLRLFAVVLIIMVGVFAGISFGHYAHTATTMHDDIYSDSESGTNLGDVWVENPRSVWTSTQSSNLCEEISTQWPDSELVMMDCEPRLVLDGLLFHSEEDGAERLVPAIWHGIDEGYVDRLWMPDHECCDGRLAQTADEIVLDAHAVEGLAVEIGDSVLIGAGQGSMEFTIVGFGYHPHHLFFASPGTIIPAESGKFVTGYLTAEGLEALANLSAGSANLLLIDIVGTPDYDLLSTDEDEGVELTPVIASLTTITTNIDSASIVYDRSGIDSVEFLRTDAEGAMKTYPVITGMLVIVAGITIFLSLQRLIQSQAREIAILRTLGIPRSAIMPSYILAPILIGMVGSFYGALLGIFVGAPGMENMYEDIFQIPVLSGAVLTSSIIEILAITMLLVLFSGIRPAWQAANLDPLSVLRGEHEVRLTSRAIQRMTARLPTTIGLTIRSSTRKPVRLAFTFFAVGLSMLILGSMLFMMDSMEDMMIGNVEENANWDTQVLVFPGTEGNVVEWAEANSVEHELLLMFPANLVDDPRQMTAYGLDEFADSGDDAMQILNLAEGRLPVADSPNPEVLIDNGIQHFLDWQVGQTQTILFGSLAVEIKVVGITEGDVSRSVYFHREDLAERVGVEATSVLLTLPGDLDSKDELGLMSIGIIEKQDMIDSMNSLMEQQQGFFVAIQMLGIIIAFVVLFNTLIMNLAERDSELATLRVLGAPLNRIGSMMLGEHFAIGLIGGVLGAIFSVLGTKWLMSQMVQWAFYMEVSADLAISVGLAGVVLFISVGLTPLGMWRVRQMDLVEKVKEFSN